MSASAWAGSEALEGYLFELSKLRPHPANAREHDERNLAAIRGSLEEFGQAHPIVIWREKPKLKTFLVLAGHGRLEAAKAMAWTHIAAVEFLGSAADAERYMQADNRTSELGRWNFRLLGESFKRLGDEGWEKLGWAEHERTPLLNADWTPPDFDPKDDAHERDSSGIGVHFNEEQAPLIEQAIEAMREDLEEHCNRAIALHEICKRWMDGADGS